MPSRRFAVARGPEGDAGVHGFGVDDGADAVVEEEAVRAGEAGDVDGQGLAGERAGGDDDDRVGRQHGHFVAAQLDERLVFDGGRDFGGESFAVDGEGVSGGHACLLSGGKQQRTEPAQLLFEQPGRGRFRLGLQRIAAHEFGQAIGLVRGCAAALDAFHAERRAVRGAPPAMRLRCRQVRRR